MSIKRKIRVLVVDDSLVFRETLARGLAADPGIEVVGTASDPYQARDRLIELEPDVMTLDVEMPRMNGIEFLRRLMPQYPLPVVVVSAVSDSVFDALNAGAVDFVAKPEAGSGRGMDSLITEMAVKIKIASVAKVSQWKQNRMEIQHVERLGYSHAQIIAMGASTGGTEAVAQILKAFPRDMPGIVVVQHMPPIFTRMYAERLNNSCLLEVREAQPGDAVRSGRVLIAPGSYHMRVIRGEHGLVVDCFEGEKVNGHCPSVDVLFRSVAEIMGRNALGIILTGMGSDGAKGLLEMRRRGARTLGQDEDSSVVYGMPKAAHEIGAVERQVGLEHIPQQVVSIIHRNE